MKPLSKLSDTTSRLAGLGGAKWEIYSRARTMAQAGRDVIELTIGEPDMPTPDHLINAATEAMRNGRTGYSDGRGEETLRQALATRYSQSTGQSISPDKVLCFPGTQTALYAVMMGVSQSGNEVLVGDPLYATYEGVIRANGADMIPVPLRPENGFRIAPEDIEARITPASSAILLTSPHNPTGAILRKSDIEAIGALAREHGLWIISDEVYEELVFDGHEFASPLAMPELADRTIVVSSISKSHAAPGFRSGWAIGPEEFTNALLPLSETMLFGNQPFIADMTVAAIEDGSDAALEMRARFQARADRLVHKLGKTALKVHQPQAGMFAMIDVSASGLSGFDYASDLLEATGVGVMPGTSFGETMQDWVRVALTVDDVKFDEACTRILDHFNALETSA